MSYLCLDVGGTEIKAGSIGADGALNGSIRSFPSCAKESKEIILQNIMHILSSLQQNTSDHVSGVGLAFPGPFDYDNGVSLLQGLDKFEALYKINIKLELEKRFKEHPNFTKDNIPIIFENDVTAFALGASLLPELRNYTKGMYVCIGTGCGSAFLNDGQPLDSSTKGVPKNGWLYPMPFRDSILDDYLSKRGLMRLSAEILGYEADGKTLAQLASSGDPAAIKCFYEFGLLILDGLRPVLEGFQPDCLVLGGQIMKSADLFADAIRNYCIKHNILCLTTSETSLHTIIGLSRKFPALQH